MEKATLLIEARPFCLSDETPLQMLKKENLNIIDMRGSGIADPLFMSAVKTANVILCGNDLIVNESFLKTAPSLKAIAKMGAGLDTIDIEAATRYGVIVFHTPGVNNHAVADHTFALILSLARQIVYCDRSLRENRWEHTKIIGLELWRKTIGLIGLGAIGRNVALRAAGFQMKVVAHDIYWPEKFADKHAIERMELDDLLKASDIISLHTPLTPESKGIIDKRALSLMKPDALLINTSRGGIIYEPDLFEALKNNVIAGAGLDVFENEPPVDSNLLTLDNVVVTPHTAAFTHEAMDRMNMGVTQQSIAFINGNLPEFAVNPAVFDNHREK